MKTRGIGGLTRLMRLMAVVGRTARRLFAALGELNNQQLRLSAVRLSQDTYLNRPGVPPDTYAEFLCRTRGPRRHEPSARARLDGHPVH